MDTGFIWDICSHKNMYSLFISVCMTMLSPLDDTVSAWNPELEYQEPFSTGKVMWKKTAPAPAHSSVVTNGFCTIQSCCLRTWSHWISISQPVLKLCNSRCEQSCRKDLHMYMSMYIQLPLGLSLCLQISRGLQISRLQSNLQFQASLFTTR